MADAARIIPRCTAKEYLEFENDGSLKHEFVNGIVYAMAGASRRHNLIAGDLHTALNIHLPPERCQAYALDTKVHINTKDEERFVYPDIFVTCSEHDNDAYSSDQPILVVEVMSPTTEEFDKVDKFKAYRSLPSLQEYGLLAQDERRLELFRKRTEWAAEVYRDDDVVTFESVDLTVSVATFYRRVTL
jgi:Uma2 family endonuclease